MNKNSFISHILLRAGWRQKKASERAVCLAASQEFHERALAQLDRDFGGAPTEELEPCETLSIQEFMHDQSINFEPLRQAMDEERRAKRVDAVAKVFAIAAVFFIGYFCGMVAGNSTPQLSPAQLETALNQLQAAHDQQHRKGE